MNPDYVFLSTVAVTDGVRSPVWEVAAYRVNAMHGRRTGRLSFQIKTPASAFPAGAIPSRYNDETAIDNATAAKRITDFMGGEPILTSADPYVEAERLTRQLRIDPPWNHVMLGINSLMAGYLSARIGGYGYFPDPYIISANLGICPERYSTDTAEGRVILALAQWARVTHREKSAG